MDYEKNALKEAVASKFDSLVGFLENIDSKLLNSAPYNTGWTIGQIAEHIIICSAGIPDQNTAEPDRDYKEKIKPIDELFLNMELKFKTSDFLEPKMPPHSLDVLILNLSKNKETLLRTIEDKDLKVVCEDMELPTFGYLTRYEWISFVLSHTQRHIWQIENIYNLLKINGKTTPLSNKN